MSTVEKPKMLFLLSLITYRDGASESHEAEAEAVQRRCVGKMCAADCRMTGSVGMLAITTLAGHAPH